MFDSNPWIRRIDFRRAVPRLREETFSRSGYSSVHNENCSHAPTTREHVASWLGLQITAHGKRVKKRNNFLAWDRRSDRLRKRSLIMHTGNFGSSCRDRVHARIPDNLPWIHIYRRYSAGYPCRWIDCAKTSRLIRPLSSTVFLSKVHNT